MVLYYSVSQGRACPGQVTENMIRLASSCLGMENRLEDCGIVDRSCDCGSLGWVACQQGKCDDHIR